MSMFLIAGCGLGFLSGSVVVSLFELNAAENLTVEDFGFSAAFVV